MTQEMDLTGTLIYTSEAAYYIIQELVTMHDRALAERIELFLWPNSPCVPPGRIQAMCNAISASEDDGDFYQRARNILSVYPDDGYPRADRNIQR